MRALEKILKIMVCIMVMIAIFINGGLLFIKIKYQVTIPLGYNIFWIVDLIVSGLVFIGLYFILKDTDPERSWVVPITFFCMLLAVFTVAFMQVAHEVFSKL